MSMEGSIAKTEKSEEDKRNIFSRGQNPPRWWGTHEMNASQSLISFTHWTKKDIIHFRKISCSPSSHHCPIYRNEGFIIQHQIIEEHKKPTKFWKCRQLSVLHRTFSLSHLPKTSLNQAWVPSPSWLVHLLLEFLWSKQQLLWPMNPLLSTTALLYCKQSFHDD